MASDTEIQADFDLQEIVNRANTFLHPADEHGKRRVALLRAAFDVIAEAGFEGLRTRAVALRAGVNIATLHYYFPTKQKLIEGVAEWMGARFVTLHGPSPQPSGIPALDRLRQEFSDGRFYLREHPELLLVIQEFSLRGKRDPEVQKIVLQLNGYWRSGLERLIRSGIAEGSFRNDLPVADLLALVMAALIGAADIPDDQIERLRGNVEAWILSDAAKAKLTPPIELESEVAQ